MMLINFIHLEKRNVTEYMQHHFIYIMGILIYSFKSPDIMGLCDEVEQSSVHTAASSWVL